MTHPAAPHRLRTEYLVNPLGLDVGRPRLSWELGDERRGASQSAWQVQVADTVELLSEDRANVWDSGRVEGDRSIQVEYAGPPLVSAQRVAWRVRAWDAQGVASPWSAPARWEMGLLLRTDWRGKFVASPVRGGRHTSAPAPYFRKSFRVERQVRRARLYTTALGVYEPWLNGRAVGEQVLAPGFTDYECRIAYQVHDVGHLLVPGDNVLGAIVGDGWYAGFVAWLGRQNWGDRPSLLAQLVVEFEDGSTLAVASDKTWQTTVGPILASDLLMGEEYDARLELGDWCMPGYDAGHWTAVEELSDPTLALSAMRTPGIRRVQELEPITEPTEIKHWPESKWLYDLGQNMVGRVRLRISGKRGTTVTLRHAEILDADGKPYFDNLRSAKCTDHYTLKGDGEEVFEPRFTFHGFRYVELSGITRPPRRAVTGVVLHTEMPVTGEFECSNELVNQLQSNIRWGQKGNFLDVPTDCPQRDERLGWTGDAQVFIRTAAFNYDVAAFFTKWQSDLADAQLESGGIPPVAPDASIMAHDSGPAWGDAVVICPWTIYRHYGDERILREHYPVLRRYLAFLRESSPDLVRAHPDRDAWGGFGDWLSINADTPKDLIGTAFFAHDAQLMGKIARVLGHDADADAYDRLFRDVRDAFVARFTTSAGLVVSQTQTAYVLALYFELLPEPLRPVAVKELIRDIDHRGVHLSTGFVGSSYLPFVLSKSGALGKAYELLLQKSWPSWLYAVTQGATTIWERWDGWTADKGFQDKGMNSFNHYAYGAIGAWLYAVVAGIDLDPEVPAYRRSILRPRPGGSLTHARARLETPYGVLESAWRVDGERFSLSARIPPNTRARICMPCAAAETVLEAGAPALGSPVLVAQGRLDDTAVFDAPAGAYAFESKLG